jgi:hypothetical protein
MVWDTSYPLDDTKPLRPGFLIYGRDNLVHQ